MLDRVLKIIKEAMREMFTGSITFHFYQGKIATVEKKEQFKI